MLNRLNTIKDEEDGFSIGTILKSKDGSMEMNPKRSSGKMEDTLLELKKIMNGIQGSFVLGDEGVILARDLPPDLVEKAESISKLIFYVIGVMKATKPFERVIMDSGDYKIISIPIRKNVLVVLASKEINIPLLKLVSNITKTKLKKEDESTGGGVIDPPQLHKLTLLYDELYGVVGRRLFEIFGEDAQEMFASKSGELKEDHPALFGDLSFDSTPKPRISRIKANAAKLAKDEIFSGYEDLLSFMIETLRDTAGKNIAEKTFDEIVTIKNQRRKSL